MDQSFIPAFTKFRHLLAAAGLFVLVGCNQYSTPAIQSTTAGTAPVAPEGATPRGVDAPNDQADPGETTGSVGGSPAGTSSAQTEPSSSNGVR